MRKLVEVTMPMKAFAGMMFAGLIILYMVSNIIYTFFTNTEVSYSIPFIFIMQGLLFVLIIAVLREVIFSDLLIKKWSFFKRISLFSISQIVLLVTCFLTFFAIPNEWAYLWLFTAIVLSLGVTVIFGISEIYYKKTGEWYTEALRVYKNAK